MKIGGLGNGFAQLTSILVTLGTARCTTTKHGTLYDFGMGVRFELVDFRIERAGKEWLEIFKTLGAILVAVCASDKLAEDFCNIDTIRSSYWLSQTKILMILFQDSTKHLEECLDAKVRGNLYVYACDGGSSVLVAIKESLLSRKGTDIELRSWKSDPKLQQIRLVEPRCSK